MSDHPRYHRALSPGLPDEVARLEFDRGTLTISALPVEQAPPGFLFDARTGELRGPAISYRAALAHLLRTDLDVLDLAREYAELDLVHDTPFEPRTHQSEALQAWLETGRRGVVVLPTGSGKSFLAELAIADVSRSTLVVVPTLDLVEQWVRKLTSVFNQGIGVLGGGQHEVRAITVSTYDSAAIHMDHLGARFGLVIFDEVHHLPSEFYRQAAQACLAPFRLGLTATFERPDGKHEIAEALVGPVVFTRSIKELAGEILADYEVELVSVEMAPEDDEAYRAARAEYRGFVEDQHIRLGGRNGWRNFLAATSRSAEGRSALLAYREQRRIAHTHARKLDAVGELLLRHREDRVIVFTNDNDTVYRLSERFLCPSITHQTPLQERADVLAGFREGRYAALVSSRVLNEGVDVPAANVAIVMSGSGSVREHVQRLGRVLRRNGEQPARLYEVVTEDSAETAVSRRRREHDAYR